MKYIIDNDTMTVISADKVISSKPLELVKRDIVKDSNISVMDIECYIDKNQYYRPFACGWLKSDTIRYSKKIPEISNLYYFTDFSSSEEMFLKCIIDLIKSEPATVYLHNLSKFESFFILKVLYKHFKVNSKYKGRLIL